MSMNNLTIDGEYRYVIEWFNEWSELQREDFIPIVVEYLVSGGNSATGGSSVYMNGVVQSMADINKDRPMSLFQCRIKLFRQWSALWPVDFKQKLQEKINEIDMKVGEKILNELNTHAEPETNKDEDNVVVIHTNANGITLNSSGNNVEDNTHNIESNNDNAQYDHNLSAVLRQETAVDDDEDIDSSINENTNGEVHGEQERLQSLPSTNEIQTEPVQQVQNNVNTTTIFTTTTHPVAAPNANQTISNNSNSSEVPIVA